MLVDGRQRGASESVLEESSEVPAAITDTGCERDLNEDRYAVIDSSSGVAWIVCDGMGGVTGGELAAQLALDAMRRDLEHLEARSPETALRGAILEANRIIVLRRQNQAFAAMGTTIVAAMFADREVVIGHVGDSRAYLLRDGAIQQLTTDHTYVQELVDRGQIEADEALSHPQAHILTRAIGSEPVLEVDLDKYWVWESLEGEQGDFLLLCTDGLYSLVQEQELANVVCSASPQKACVQLVELAKSRGGFDNITLVIIPLRGQLRREPPEGYQPRPTLVRRPRRLESEKESQSWWQLLRFLLLVGVLSFLSVLLTIFVTAFQLRG